ncbi:hypothetical protein [Bartonella australis]|uniref:hypothetical protein n=1 Tax=Bartonella australis TaxID=388640 RepID=UPI001650FF4A|nr:hypothetical protein [Bartonella australis]
MSVAFNDSVRRSQSALTVGASYARTSEKFFSNFFVIGSSGYWSLGAEISMSLN